MLVSQGQMQKYINALEDFSRRMNLAAACTLSVPVPKVSRDLIREEVKLIISVLKQCH